MRNFLSEYTPPSRNPSRVVGEGVGEEGRELVAVKRRHVVVVALGMHAAMEAVVIEGARGAQVDRAADAALERRGFRGLEHVGAGDHLRGQHVEGQVAAIVIGGENAAVERDDVVLRSKAADR